MNSRLMPVLAALQLAPLPILFALGADLPVLAGATVQVGGWLITLWQLWHLDPKGLRRYGFSALVALTLILAMFMAFLPEVMVTTALAIALTNCVILTLVNLPVYIYFRKT